MWVHSNLMSSGTRNTEALGDIAHLIVRLPDSSWWSCYHFEYETLSICIRLLHQLLLEHLPSFSSCSVWCLSNKPLQTHGWLKFPIVHVRVNITVSKCHCTQNKLLQYLKVRRLSVTSSGCTFLLYNIQMSAWPVTRLLSWSLGYWQQHNTDQLS